MLRQVVRALRIGLLVLGVILLLWIPLSMNALAEVALGSPLRGIRFSSTAGHAAISRLEPPHGRHQEPMANFEFAVQWRFYLDWTSLVPGYQRSTLFDGIPGSLYEPATALSGPSTFHIVHVPLWLLSALCLIWPMTSFIVARRRRKARGFEVETKAGRAVSPADS